MVYHSLMNAIELSLFLMVSSFFAGIIGALSGMGGGIIIVPLLVIGAGVDIHYAIGSSLLAVIATSMGAAVTYSKEGYSNTKLATLFVTITIVLAIVGASVTSFAPAHQLKLLFGCVLLLIGILSLIPHKYHQGVVGDYYHWAERLGVNGTIPTKKGLQEYHVHGIPAGYSLMGFAGFFSGLLGIGSGCLQVPIMDRVMHLPFKVATATSNIVIGITGAASAGIYLNKGYIDPGLTMPVVLGNLGGAYLGAQLMERIGTNMLRYLFLVLILAIAARMIYGGLA